MNGRVYDYNVGRFLSVDLFVHKGSQGINPYSYILNNPLAGTDPTGYKPEIEEFVKEVQIGDTTVKVIVKITKENDKAKAEVSSVSKQANDFVSGAIKGMASQHNTAVANVGSNTGNDESGGGVPEEIVRSGGVSGEVSTSGDGGNRAPLDGSGKSGTIPRQNPAEAVSTEALDDEHLTLSEVNRIRRANTDEDLSVTVDASKLKVKQTTAFNRRGVAKGLLMVTTGMYTGQLH